MVCRVCVLFYIAIASELLKASLKGRGREVPVTQKKTKSTSLGWLKPARFPRIPLQGCRSNEQLLEETDQQSCEAGIVLIS